MSFIIWLMIGFVLGSAVEWYSWYRRCKKNNLFDKEGNLKTGEKDEK